MYAWGVSKLLTNEVVDIVPWTFSSGSPLLLLACLFSSWSPTILPYASALRFRNLVEYRFLTLSGLLPRLQTYTRTTADPCVCMCTCACVYVYRCLRPCECGSFTHVRVGVQRVGIVNPPRSHNIKWMWNASGAGKVVENASSIWLEISEDSVWAYLYKPSFVEFTLSQLFVLLFFGLVFSIGWEARCAQSPQRGYNLNRVRFHCPWKQSLRPCLYAEVASILSVVVGTALDTASSNFFKSPEWMILQSVAHKMKSASTNFRVPLLSLSSHRFPHVLNALLLRSPAFLPLWCSTLPMEVCSKDCT